MHERPRLWDAPKFRLAETQVNAPDQSHPAAPAVTLQLGLTSYKEYVGTNTDACSSETRAALRRDGLAMRGDERAHLSCALGVETVLETSDGCMVLLRRSDEVATFGGVYNGPSGHPEPARVEEALASAADSHAAGLVVRAEIFRSVLEEVQDETGVPLNALSPPRLIGVMEDAWGKPDLLFLTRTAYTAAQVAAKRNEACEAWESSEVAAVAATPPSDAEERAKPGESRSRGGKGGGSSGSKSGDVRVGEPVRLGVGSRLRERELGGESGCDSVSVTSPAASGADALLTTDYWTRSDVVVSPVTRAAVDCLYMLAALLPGGSASSGAPALPVPPHVWENALDAAMEHRLDGIARSIEQRNLAHLGFF